MSEYGHAEYWEERYTRDPEPFDWYQRYSGIKEIINEHCKHNNKILHVGCGNSRMSEEMFDEGYTYQINIDMSTVCIKAMQEKYKERGPYFKYMVMDIMSSEFETGEFDCIIDKGTLDSILCGDSATVNSSKTQGDIHRILKSGGVYICISYGMPQHREHYQSKPEYDWEVSVQKVFKPTISTSITIAADDKDSPNVHYVYICKKRYTD